MNEKILVIEDERALSKVLRYNLEKEGYRVVGAADGEAGLDLFRRERPDLLILDLMLPKMDGFEVCKAVRSGGQGAKTPILMLTAKKDEMDRVLGLELGADDYVTKPFSIRELCARVKALLRRVSDRGAAGTGATLMRAGGLELDLERYETRVSGRTVELSTKEYEFLKCLFLAQGRAMTRDELLEKIWGYDRSMEIDTRTVDQHIARLRDKLGSEAPRVLTVKNVGYRLKTD